MGLREIILILLTADQPPITLQLITVTNNVSYVELNQSINQSIKTVIQVDQPQRDRVIWLHVAKNEKYIKICNVQE